MIGISQPLSEAARINWCKFRIAEALGPGEHAVRIAFPGRPVLLEVCGPDYNESDQPTAVIEAFHPDIEGIGWEDIWDAVRHEYPNISPMRQATDDDYQSLKNSIAQFGSLQRVIVDEFGNVIAGRLRKRACEELGVQCPTEVISGLTDEMKEQLAFELDFCRKQISRTEKRRTAELFLRGNPRNADRVIGRACGLDHKTVGRIREELEGSGDIPQVDLREARDGKTYKFPKIVVNTKKEEQRAQDALETLGPDAPKRPLDLKRAEQLSRQKQADERRLARKLVPHLPEDSIQILHCDFRDLPIENGSVPLILTDPPYDQGCLPLWQDLAKWAKQKLRPDGFLVTYSGIMFLPEVLAALSSELTYVWQMALVHEEGQDNIWPRNIVNKYKPVLIFSNGLPSCPMKLVDLFAGGGKEKEYHEWQQNLGEFMHFIESFSKPGDLVVDPFGGGFTTAAACHQLGRRCLICDISEEAVQNGLLRMARLRGAAQE